MAVPGMLLPDSFEPDLSHTSILYYRTTRTAKILNVGVRQLAKTLWLAATKLNVINAANLVFITWSFDKEILICISNQAIFNLF
jgi:hypothetical protein